VTARAKEPLTDQVQSGEDEEYYGTGLVGETAPQQFTFDFDTGSSDTFVPGPSCSSSAGCVGTARYPETGRSTGNTTTVTYGSGEVVGNNYLDTVSIAGLAASNQGFISLTDASGLTGSDSNSLMGMGFQSIANSGFTPFFQNLVAQGKVRKAEFAFYLGRSASGTANASELVLGSTDTAKYSGALTTIPVTTEGYWQVAIDGASVDGRSAGAATAGQAAIDTGTTIILAPTAATAAIFSLIPDSIAIPPFLSGESGTLLYAYPCASTAIPSLEFAGKSFAIDPQDFNLGQLDDVLISLAKVEISRKNERARQGHGGEEGELQQLEQAIESGQYCVASVAGMDIDPDESLYVVGDVFLKSWYSVFSFTAANGKPAVSFAKAV